MISYEMIWNDMEYDDILKYVMTWYDVSYYIIAREFQRIVLHQWQ